MKKGPLVYVLAVALMTVTICRADPHADGNIEGVRSDQDVNTNSQQLRSSRVMKDLLPESISQVPLGKILDFGYRALRSSSTARSWPAGLAALVVGTSPSTGAIVGTISIAIFVIVIWLIVYSIGVLPVGAAFPDLVREMMADGYMPPAIPPVPQSYSPYAYRFKRSLAEASQSVMSAMDQFQQKQQETTQ